MKKRQKKSQFAVVMKRLLKNKGAVVGLIIIILLILMAIFAKQIMPYDYAAQDYSAILKGSSAEHLLGTDNLGRDLFSRLIYGGRMSITIGITAVIIGACLGGFMGLIAGYYGGTVDNLIMRFLDIYQCVPEFVLALAMSSVFGFGVWTTSLAIGIATLGGYARLLRSSVLTVKGAEYIEAAKSVKGSDLHIMFKHILPNAIAPMIVQMTMGIGAAILTTSMLGFVGMGIPAPTPEWGAMLAEGRGYMRDYGYLVMLPGLCIILTVLSFNLFGDGLRDALDPKLKS